MRSWQWNAHKEQEGKWYNLTWLKYAADFFLLFLLPPLCLWTLRDNKRPLQTFVLISSLVPPSLAALPGRQWSLHGFSIQRQHVSADVLLQPQRGLLPALGSRGWWEGVQWHHLAVDRRTGHVWQHCGGGGGLCLCLLTDVGAETRLLLGGGGKCTAWKYIFFINDVK